MMKAYMELEKTVVFHQKSFYTVFDLLGDMGGLLDIAILLFAFFLEPYNQAIFHYNTFNRIYQVKKPFNSFFDFWRDRTFSCFCLEKNKS